MGGVQDQLRRAVVLLELDDGGVRIVALEVEDVADVGAAPGVDRLVVVPYDAQVLCRGGQRLDPEILGTVGVLILVHVEVAPPALIALQHGGGVLEEPHRLEQEVVEVEGVGRAEPRLVAAEEPRDLAFSMCVGVRGDELGVEHLVLGPRDGPEDRAGLVLPCDRQVFLAQDLLHERLLVVRVVDDEMPVQADGRSVAAQDPGAQGMERAHCDLAARLVSDQAGDAGAQLGGRLVGERHGQDLPRPDALDADEVGDAVSQHARLAAAGAGQDEDRPVGRPNGPLLLGIEAGQDASRQRLGGSLALGQGDRLGLERRRLGRLDARPVEGLRRRLVRGRRLVGQRAAAPPGGAAARAQANLPRRMASADLVLHPGIVGAREFTPAHGAPGRS